MKYLHLTLPTPAENLAADEALLELAEQSSLECLRIWESTTPFVVLGLSNQLSREVDATACERAGIPILRRVSGGGTVVQCPGCLSYALTLRIGDSEPLTSIRATNQFIMERNRGALEALIGRPVSIRGHTDLETTGRKFSGNAQRRGRRALLFHGTILYAANLGLFDQLLQHPSREPDWRARRTHHEFVGNLGATCVEIVTALRQAWDVNEPATQEFIAGALKPLAARHANPAWIHRLP